MRVLLLTDDTTAPSDLVETLEARGHEVLIRTGAELSLPLPAPLGEDVGPWPIVVVHRSHGSQSSGPETAAALLHIERAQRESEERYRSLFDGVPVGLYRTKPSGELLDANAAIVRLLGYPDRDSLLAANSAGMYLDPEDRLRWQRAVEGGGTVQAFEARMRRLDGTVIWGRFSVRAVLGADGQVVHYEGAMEDVTEQKRAEEALRASEERFRALVQNASDMIAILSAEGTVLYGSPSHERVLGLDLKALRRPSILDFVHPDDRERVIGILAQLIERPDEVIALEVRIRHADGTYRVLESTAANLLAHPAVLGLVLNSHDITARKRAEERLLHEALHDELTDLPNRAFFMDRLRAAMAKVRRDPSQLVAVLFLDVDRFKIVNDSLGHPAGDALLIQIATALAAALRPSDIISRVGGDEFAILLEGGHDVSDAVRVAERIHERLTGPIFLDGHEIFITASLGIAVCTPEYERPEDLLRDADTAMYRAKASGRACHVIFHRGMHHSVVARLKLETDLRRAIDRGELLLHYQPFISLVDDEVVGFEALVRWLHPQRGLLLPEEFLAVAEETGLLVPIGRFVLAEACGWVHGLQERHPGSRPLSLSVNLSHKQFFHPDLLSQIEEALAVSRLAPGSLGLEITEGVILRGSQVTASRLASLKELGVQLFLDDFGKGYSSLNYLHRFPVDRLKIDRSFTARLEEAASNLAIVEAIIKLAHQLGMKVVAEGIETAGQLEKLRGFGCEYGQGLLFAPPLAAPEAEALLAARRVSR